MNWTPLEVVNPPKVEDKYSLEKRNKEKQIIGSLFENSPLVEIIDFGDYAFTEIMEIKTASKFKSSDDRKIAWSSIHVRHKIRIYCSIVLFLIFSIDLILNILSLPAIWDSFSDIVSIVGSLGLLGTSVYITIDSSGR